MIFVLEKRKMSFLHISFEIFHDKNLYEHFIIIFSQRHGMDRKHSFPDNIFTFFALYKI